MKTSKVKKYITSGQSNNTLFSVNTYGVKHSEQKQSFSDRLVLTPDEKKRLVDFFAVLIEIDRNLYLGSIGIMTRPQGDYRPVYPHQKGG